MIELFSGSLVGEGEFCNLIKLLNATLFAVAAIFSLAHKLQPAIIFIDEVDSFLRKRSSRDHEVSAKMKTEFMALWDGFTTDRTFSLKFIGIPLI